MTFVMLMPRSSGGGAPVMVARRPPSTSVLSASASPPPAAFAAARMPDDLAASLARIIHSGWLSAVPLLPGQVARSRSEGALMNALTAASN